MSQVVIAGDTSGTITLQAPAVSGSSVLTLPATTATLATLTTPSFASTIGVGGTTAANSGAGVSFPATQSNSSDANTLDDYEEGTWTPSVGGSATYSVQQGNYTKIGNLVFCRCALTINSIGSGSATSISGLPFTAASTTNGAAGISVGAFYSLASSVISLYAFVAGNSTSIFFGSQSSSGSSYSYPTNVWGNGARIDFSFTYLST